MASVRCKAEGCKKWSFQQGYCREHLKSTLSPDKNTSSLDGSLGYINLARLNPPVAAARGSLPSASPRGSLAELLVRDGTKVLSRNSSAASSRAASPEGARHESDSTKAQDDPGLARSELVELQARLAKAEADIKRERETNASLSSRLDSEQKARIAADELNKKLQADLEALQAENTTLKAQLQPSSGSSLQIPLRRNSRRQLSATALDIGNALAKLDGIITSPAVSPQGSPRGSPRGSQVDVPVRISSKLSQDSCNSDLRRSSTGSRHSRNSTGSNNQTVVVAASRFEHAAIDSRPGQFSAETMEYDPDYAMFMDEEDAEYPMNGTASIGSTGSEKVWDGKKVHYRPKLESSMSFCVSEADDEWSEFKNRTESDSSRF